jgi:hypothetical protein
MQPPAPAPVPDLRPQGIKLEQHEAFTPEKLELWEGFLIAPPDWHDERRNVLLLLLSNEGLEEAVRLAPKKRWREALRSVYGAS